MDYTQDTTKHTKGKHFSYGDQQIKKHQEK